MSSRRSTRTGADGLRALALTLAPPCPHPVRGWHRFPLSTRPDGVPVHCAACNRWSVVYPRSEARV